MEELQSPLPGFDPGAPPETRVTRKSLDRIDRLLKKAQKAQISKPASKT